MIILSLCGMPGAGKTTLSRMIAQRTSLILYNYDEFKRQEPNPYKYHTMHDKMYSAIVSDLKSGKSVIVDDLHLTEDSRASLLTKVSNADCLKILLVMDTPFEECMRRNASRDKYRIPDQAMCDLQHIFQPPTLSEGWDEIIYIKN